MHYLLAPVIYIPVGETHMLTGVNLLKYDEPVIISIFLQYGCPEEILQAIQLLKNHTSSI